MRGLREGVGVIRRGGMDSPTVFKKGPRERKVD